MNAYPILGFQLPLSLRSILINKSFIVLYFVQDYATYRQLLYRTIERAINLDYQKIDFGMTASFEKKKLGAKVHERYAFIQTADNFILETLGVMEGQH